MTIPDGAAPADPPANRAKEGSEERPKERSEERAEERLAERAPERPPERLAFGVGAAQRAIAFRRTAARDGRRPGLVWLGGFKSDMAGAKALALEGYAQDTGRAFVRFDYSGHGESGGAFCEGTIGRWLDESLAVLRTLTAGPQVLVGSSMGGWIALLMARALAAAGETARLGGMALIAPAVDFTEELMWPRLSAAARDALETDGLWLSPSAYGPEPTPLTRALFEDGRRHLLFPDGAIRSYGPTHIVQGMEDPDVPWRHALRLVEHMPADPVALTLVKDGDHRLSRPQDLTRLIAAVDQLA